MLDDDAQGLPLVPTSRLVVGTGFNSVKELLTKVTEYALTANTAGQRTFEKRGICAGRFNWGPVFHYWAVKVSSSPCHRFINAVRDTVSALRPEGVTVKRRWRLP